MAFNAYKATGWVTIMAGLATTGLFWWQSRNDQHIAARDPADVLEYAVEAQHAGTMRDTPWVDTGTTSSYWDGSEWLPYEFWAVSTYAFATNYAESPSVNIDLYGTNAIGMYMSDALMYTNIPNFVRNVQNGYLVWVEPPVYPATNYDGYYSGGTVSYAAGVQTVRFDFEPLLQGSFYVSSNNAVDPGYQAQYSYVSGDFYPGWWVKYGISTNNGLFDWERVDTNGCIIAPSAWYATNVFNHESLALKHVEWALYEANSELDYTNYSIWAGPGMYYNWQPEDHAWSTSNTVPVVGGDIAGALAAAESQADAAWAYVPAGSITMPMMRMMAENAAPCAFVRAEYQDEVTPTNVTVWGLAWRGRYQLQSYPWETGLVHRAQWYVRAGSPIGHLHFGVSTDWAPQIFDDLGSGLHDASLNRTGGLVPLNSVLAALDGSGTYNVYADRSNYGESADYVFSFSSESTDSQALPISGWCGMSNHPSCTCITLDDFVHPRAIDDTYPNGGWYIERGWVVRDAPWVAVQWTFDALTNFPMNPEEP